MGCIFFLFLYLLLFLLNFCICIWCRMICIYMRLLHCVHWCTLGVFWLNTPQNKYIAVNKAWNVDRYDQIQWCPSQRPKPPNVFLTVPPWLCKWGMYWLADENYHRVSLYLCSSGLLRLFLFFRCFHQGHPSSINQCCISHTPLFQQKF